MNNCDVTYRLLKSIKTQSYMWRQLTVFFFHAYRKRERRQRRPYTISECLYQYKDYFWNEIILHNIFELGYNHQRKYLSFKSLIGSIIFHYHLYLKERFLQHKIFAAPVSFPYIKAINFHKNWLGEPASASHRDKVSMADSRPKCLSPLTPTINWPSDHWPVVGACCEWERVLIRILRILHSRLVPPQIQHKFLQARKTNGIWQQRTLRNKQFNIHNKTGIKINEKHNVRSSFWRNTVMVS